MISRWLDSLPGSASMGNASAVDDSPVVSTGSNRDAHPSLLRIL